MVRDPGSVRLPRPWTVRGAHEWCCGRAAVAGFLFRESEGTEQVDQTEMAPVVEGGRQHADDVVGFAVDANDAADDVGVTAEARLPEAVTDHEDAVGAREVVHSARSASVGLILEAYLAGM